MRERRSPHRIVPLKAGAVYRQVWRIVDGAVRDAFRQHPDYLSPCRREAEIRRSIVKRVTGAFLGYVGEARRHRAEPD
jgi:hypothetical protein